MKKHLEYKDEKTAKFWEIELEGMSITTTYGKIGTDGKSTTKELATEEKALKEFEKLVKSKTRKGYKEPVEEIALQTISVTAAKDSVSKKNLTFKKECLEFIDAWWEVEEEIRYSDTSFKTEKLDIPHMAIINGDLEVGLIEAEYYSFLIVLGNLTVNNAIINCQVIVTGNVIINNTAVLESFGDNTLMVGGNLEATHLIELDHHIEVLGEIEVGEIHYERGAEFEGVSFVADCLEEEYPDFDAIADKIRKQEAVFVFEDVSEEVHVNAFLIDLSCQGIKETPASTFENTNAKILNLAHVEIDELPKEIGQLENLKELILQDNFVKGFQHQENPVFNFPETIGNLKKLETIISIGNHPSIPDSIGQMKSVKTLHLIGQGDAWLTEVPSFIKKMPNIIELDLSNNSLVSIPENILSLKKLETLNLSCSLGFLKTPLPDFSKLTSLRKLSVTGEGTYQKNKIPSQDILSELMAMELNQLEELEISRWGENKERPNLTTTSLKDLHKFTNLRVLDLSSNDLEQLPEEIFQLQKLERVILKGNNIPAKQLLRLEKHLYPDSNIDPEVTPNESDKNLLKVQELIEEAGKDLYSKKAISLFKKAIALCENGKPFREYDYLFAHNRIIYACRELIENRKDKNKKEFIKDILFYGENAFKKCFHADEKIWGCTAESVFEMESIEYIGMSLVHYTIKSTKSAAKLENIVPYLERTMKYGDIYVSSVQVLYVNLMLKIEEKEKAFQVVQQQLSSSPCSSDFFKFKTDEEYIKWLGNQYHKNQN